MEAMVDSYQTRLKSVLPTVSYYERKLDSLNDWWAKIALIGKINSYGVATTILSEMQSTRGKFGELQLKLIDNLLLEHLKKSVLDDTSRSQVAVDILIRNLFERTADVGFLATDDDIRNFLSLPDASLDAQLAIETRLNEYVKKYSVYDEIIILDPQGEVQAHLNPDNPVEFSRDALIAQTLDTTDDYIETFRYSDLQPNQPYSLIYSCKITETNEPISKVLGVLCLCFRFDSEMESIFRRLLSSGRSSSLMLLDDKGYVIATSDSGVMAIGDRHQPLDKPSVVKYQGSDYLVNTTQTRGYEGFYGLGWSGHMMSPIDSMFKVDESAPQNDSLDTEIDSSRLFSSALKDIHRTSLDVNEDLRLVVLNGKITAAREDAVEFIPILEAIKQIGEDTATIFEESILSLQDTVISSRMNEVQFLANLAVDVMDRNLYERANDCRWWALNSLFRSRLSQPQVSPDEASQMCKVLSYINELYTVYSNIYLYDSRGKILAVSNPQETHLLEQIACPESGASQALNLCDTQAYAVSPFAATPYYGGQHTYIYNAAVLHPDRDGNAVGGIGVVFDSAPQFEAMLNDALPHDEQGEVLEGCFGLYTDRLSNVISATALAGLCAGELLALDSDLFEVECGQHLSRVLSFRGELYVVGVAASQGYREYKTTGDYSNDVLAFVFVPF